MAEATSTYPTPPAFYSLYSGTTPIRPPNPPKLVEGTYTVFGTSSSAQPALPPLQGQAKFQEGPDGTVDVKGELSRLNNDLLASLEQLMDVLENRPSQYARSLENVLALINSMTHLSNSLRPQQARASLKHMLTLAVEQKRSALLQLQAHAKAVSSQVVDTATTLASRAP